MRRLWIVMAALLLMAVVLPAQAQEGTAEFEWSLYDAYLVGDPNHPSNVEWTGVTECDIDHYFGNNRGLGPTAWMQNMSCADVVWGDPGALGHFTVDLGEATTVLSVQLGWRWCCGSYPDIYLNGGLISSDTVIDNANYSTPDFVYDTPFASSGVVDIGWDKMYLDYVKITYTSDEPPPALTRPLSAIDENGWGMEENPNGVSGQEANAVIAYSDLFGRFVHAAAEGVVTDIRRAKKADCTSFGLLGSTIFYEGLCAFHTPNPFADGLVKGADQGGDNTSIYIVSLFAPAEGKTFEYWVDDPTPYVSVGQHLEPGCIVGRTWDFGIEGQLEDDEYDAFASLGATILTARDSSGAIVPVYDELTEEPDSHPCNINPEFAQCINDDPELRDAGVWRSGADEDLAIFERPGFTLKRGAEISATLNLDASRMPEVVVYAKGEDGNATFAISLGRTVGAATATPGYPQRFVLNGAEHEPDAGEFFTVRVKNASGAGNNNVLISGICVQYTDEETPPPQPTEEQATCTFLNQSFDAASANWTLSGGAATQEIYEGVILMPDGSSLAQSISVQPGTYTLVAVFDTWSFSTYVPDDTNTDEGLTLQYKFPSDEDYVDLADTLTWGEVAYTGLRTLSGSIVISEAETNEPFAVKVVLTDPPSGVRGIRLQSLCLQPPGTSTGGSTSLCGNIPYPTGQDLGSWTSWHWQNLNKYFRCELSPLLTKMYDTMRSFFQTALWSIRWNMSATTLGVKWFTGDFVRWLNGTFANLITGNITTITGGTEQCGNIFCAITGIFGSIESVINNFISALRDLLSQILGELLIPILRQIADLLIGILQSLGNFIFNGIGTLILELLKMGFKVVNYAFYILDLGRVYFAAIITSYQSSSPIAISGIVNCTAAPQSSAICVGVWMLDNTAFSGTGAAIIPIVVGIMSIRLMLWIAYEAKKTIMGLKEMY